MTVQRPAYTRADAVFSDDGGYRYWLERRWDDALAPFTYILLNPSKAGSEDDDTVKRLVAITMFNGGGGFELANLFATVDTNQVGLHLPSAVGLPDNDEWIARVVKRSTKLVLGWGDGNAETRDNRGRQQAVRGRARTVWHLVSGRDPWCLTRTKTGAPHHPRGLPNTTVVAPYHPPPGYP